MKTVTKLASILFAAVALGHVARLCFGWEVTINHWPLPLWVSVVGAVVPAGLSVALWRASR